MHLKERTEASPIILPTYQTFSFHPKKKNTKHTENKFLHSISPKKKELLTIDCSQIGDGPWTQNRIPISMIPDHLTALL